MKFHIFVNLFFSRGNFHFHIFQPVTIDICKIWNLVSTKISPVSTKLWNLVSTKISPVSTKLINKMMTSTRSEEGLIIWKIGSDYARRIR